jgi:DNA-binding NtrC family response regulator
LRDDLYYRLNVFQLNVPSLRERLADIPLLAQHFVDQMARKNNKNVKGIHPRALHYLRNYSWPGNVRELKNIIERAVLVARDNMIIIHDLPSVLRNEPVSGPTLSFPVGTKIETMERMAIVQTLDLTDGNKTEAAKLLGISLKTLHNKINQYGLRRT